MAHKILLIVLILFSLFLRFYNFDHRINFGMEQGMTLSTTASYIHDKFSLLGMSNVARVTHDGHMVLINPLFNYSLVPAMLLLGKNPITLTYLALITNLLTALAVYIITKKIFDKSSAIFATLYFLFNLTMIEHSLTLWIHNIIPLLGIVSFYLLASWNKKQTISIMFLLGILSGVGFAMEYIYLATLGLIGIYLLFTSKSKLSVIIFYGIGCILPQLPMIIFDLRHDFYNFRTLWQYTLDTFANPSQSKMAFYHFLQFYPLVFMCLGYLTKKVYESRRLLTYVIMATYIGFTLLSPKLSLNRAIGTPVGMDAPLLMDFAKVIALDVSLPYNIVYLPQSEYRGHALRYLLTYIHKRPPMGVEEYASAKVIYVIGDKDLDLLKERPWEVGAFGPTKSEILANSSNKLFSLYKLTQ